MDSPSTRNWAELPRDVTLTILMKLTPIETLETAQFVCKVWYNLCMDPSMWTCVDFENIDDYETGFSGKYEKMARSAVERSRGGVRSVSVEYFGTDDLLMYIADRSSCLRCLRFACCYSLSGISNAVKKLPLLEELELTLCSISEEEIKAVGLSCPMLKTFKLNHQGSRNPFFTNDSEAFVIAETMPRLRCLQIIGNGLTNYGLEAVLHNCSYLESLDLRSCFHVDLSGDLGKRCTEQIKFLHRPCDSTDDYKFVTSTDYESDYEDYGDGFDDGDFLSDDEYYEFSDDREMPDTEEMFDYD
ncbi:hypothetical protein Droror1_Dr00003587 [Drosera rotundifolia]